MSPLSSNCLDSLGLFMTLPAPSILKGALLKYPGFCNSLSGSQIAQDYRLFHRQANVWQSHKISVRPAVNRHPGTIALYYN